MVRELGSCCVNEENLRHILDADAISVFEDDGRLGLFKQIESYMEYKEGFARNIMYNPNGDENFCKYLHSVHLHHYSAFKEKNHEELFRAIKIPKFFFGQP